MLHDAGDPLDKVLSPLESLRSKSEKAQRRVAAGTWQHSMLQENLKALHIAISLIKRESDERGSWEAGDFEQARKGLASMIDRSKKAQAKLALGSASHTLLQNRIKALETAARFIQDALDGEMA